LAQGGFLHLAVHTLAAIAGVGMEQGRAGDLNATGMPPHNHSGHGGLTIPVSLPAGERYGCRWVIKAFTFAFGFIGLLAKLGGFLEFR